MTKKDFQLIADVLATFEGRSDIAQPELVVAFADTFATLYPQFKPGLFEIAAAPVENERLKQRILDKFAAA